MRMQISRRLGREQRTGRRMAARTAARRGCRPAAGELGSPSLFREDENDDDKEDDTEHEERPDDDYGVAVVVVADRSVVVLRRVARSDCHSGWVDHGQRGS